MVSAGRASRLKRAGGCEPGFAVIAAATTASFSMGLKEQVEKTRRPPGLSRSIARSRMRSWRLSGTSRQLSSQRQGKEKYERRTCAGRCRRQGSISSRWPGSCASCRLQNTCEVENPRG